MYSFKPVLSHFIFPCRVLSLYLLKKTFQVFINDNNKNVFIFSKKPLALNRGHDDEKKATYFLILQTLLFSACLGILTKPSAILWSPL